MNSIVIPNPDNSLIYDGGGVSQIAADELKDNPVAIRQLINSHNLVAKQVKEKEDTINELTAQLEYLKTSPFTAIFSALGGLIGSLLIGIATNFITGQPASDKNTGLYYLMLGAGIVLVGGSSLAPILHPYARGWFNKKPTTKP